MKIHRQLGFSLLFAGTALFSASCSESMPTASNPGATSVTTGLDFNKDEAMEVNDFLMTAEGPGLVFIEGGRTTLGSQEEDVAMTRDNIERTVTVASFYMDEAEVTNISWQEYMFYVRKDSSEEVYQSTLPDTTVWAQSLSFNDPYVDYYLRYPGFRFFPVVGVSWQQANDYCTWRTAKVNEKLAKDNDVEIPEGGRVPIESGAVLPNYRLPTEAEWEYAAQAMIGTQEIGDETQANKRIYPWDGHQARNPYGEEMGKFLANFKRGRGDYAGIAGALNDGAMITEYVYNYPPNDFGLYNMAGNVNEWVQDVYRPLSFQDVEDLNPFRRDGTLDDEKGYDKKGFRSLIDDHVRVYKGGSWRDVAYWLSPGTRRFMAEDSATSTIGFRCAMINAGTNH
jgi:formylglycine-generating enzyme